MEIEWTMVDELHHEYREEALAITVVIQKMGEDHYRLYFEMGEDTTEWWGEDLPSFEAAEEAAKGQLEKWADEMMGDAPLESRAADLIAGDD